MPPTQVQLPDGNIGEFPEGMSTADIETVLQKQYPPQQSTAQSQSQPGAASRFASGAWRATGGTLSGLWDAVSKTLTPEEQQIAKYDPSGGAAVLVKRLLVDPSTQASQHVEDVAQRNGKVGTPQYYAGKALAYLPLLGPIGLSTGERAAGGDVAGALGEVAGMSVAPEAIRGVSSVLPRRAAPTAPPAETIPSEYQTAPAETPPIQFTEQGNAPGNLRDIIASNPGEAARLAVVGQRMPGTVLPTGNRGLALPGNVTPTTDVIAANATERAAQLGRGTRMTQPVTLPTENRGLALPAGPAEAAPASAVESEGPLPDFGSGAGVPRTMAGESVLNQVLTSLDNKTLLKVAKSRGISVTREAQLKPGVANDLIVKKIIDDFSPDELDEVRNIGLETSLNPAQHPDLGPKLGPEDWHNRVLGTFFPDVKIPAASLKRTQAAVDAARAASQPEKTAPTEDLTGILTRSLEALKNGRQASR